MRSGLYIKLAIRLDRCHVSSCVCCMLQVFVSDSPRVHANIHTHMRQGGKQQRRWSLPSNSVYTKLALPHLPAGLCRDVGVVFFALVCNRCNTEIKKIIFNFSVLLTVLLIFVLCNTDPSLHSVYGSLDHYCSHSLVEPERRGKVSMLCLRRVIDKSRSMNPVNPV